MGITTSVKSKAIESGTVIIWKRKEKRSEKAENAVGRRDKITTLMYNNGQTHGKRKKES